MKRVTVAVILLSVTLATIFAVGLSPTLMKASFHSIGELKLTLDGWTVSHFLMYTSVGMILPGHPLPAFLVGVSYELFEILMRHVEAGIRKKNKKFKFFEERKELNGTGGYWFARATDVLVNMLGYFLGSHLGDKIRGTNEPSRFDEHMDNKEALYTIIPFVSGLAAWGVFIAFDKQFDLVKATKEIVKDDPEGEAA